MSNQQPVSGVAPIEPLDRRLLLAAQVYSTDFGFGVAGHVDAPAERLIVPLPDGKILTVGDRFFPGDPDESDDPGESLTFATRATAGGAVDRTFGNNGSLELDN